MWVDAGDKGASLSGPLGIRDGTVDLQVRLGDVDRVSLRIHAARTAGAFRVVLARGAVDVARIPAAAEPADRAVQVANRKLRFDAADWQTIRLTFAGDELSVQFAGADIRCRDPLFAEPKERLHCIAFEGKAGLRRLVVTEPE